MKLLRHVLPLSVSLALITMVHAIPALAQAASGTPISNDLHRATANPRLVRITQGDDRGAILASVAPGVFYRSTDHGATFRKVSKITYPAGVDWDCCGVLFEMPRTVGSVSAGTILFSADYCEGGRMSINIYSSADDGNSWKFLAAPVTGGKCANGKGVAGDGLWEPEFEVASDGSLVLFWSDETDPCCSQKLSQIRTTDGRRWQDKKDTVASRDHAARPGMAVVSRTPSGKYFMTYELCGTANCDVMYRTSGDGWDFGPPADMGKKVLTSSGRYFEHAPRNIWFPPDQSADASQPSARGQGELIVVGQVLFEKNGQVSHQDGEILFENPSEDGSGPWRSIPAPVKVPDANLRGKDVCQNYSSSLLPVKDASALLEMASDHNSVGVCTSYFATEPLPKRHP